MRSWELKGQAIIYVCKPGAICGRKRNFIPTFLLEGYLCIKYIKYSTSRAISWDFGAT